MDATSFVSARYLYSPWEVRRMAAHQDAVNRVRLLLVSDELSHKLDSMDDADLEKLHWFLGRGPQSWPAPAEIAEK